MSNPDFQRRIDRIQREVSVRQLWLHFKFPFEDSGEDQQVQCPFHDDRTPSAKLFLSQDKFWCWTCGEGGDVLWVAQKVLGLSFKLVLTWLESTFMVPEEDYAARFALAQKALHPLVQTVDLVRYWDTRHKDFASTMLEHLDGPYRRAWLGILSEIYDNFDDISADIHHGLIEHVDEVAYVFDWAYRMVRVYERHLEVAA